MHEPSPLFPKLQKLGTLVQDNRCITLQPDQSSARLIIQRHALSERVWHPERKFNRLARLELKLKEGLGGTPLELVASPLRLQSCGLLTMTKPRFA